MCGDGLKRRVQGGTEGGWGERGCAGGGVAENISFILNFIVVVAHGSLANTAPERELRDLLRAPLAARNFSPAGHPAPHRLLNPRNIRPNPRVQIHQAVLWLKAKGIGVSG